MAQSIRVLLANRPRLMRELVLEAIIDEPDIEIVAEIKDEANIAQVVEGMRPDFLIVTLDEFGQLSDRCGALLRQYPGLKILALAPERNVSMFYWTTLDVHSSQVETSEAGLLSTLRRGRQYVA